MAVPNYQAFMLPLLRCLSDGEAHSFRNLCATLADEFNLTSEDRAQQVTSGQPTYVNRIGWARSYLKQAGLVQSPARSMAQITEMGKRTLSENPPQINVKYLERFAAFVEFRKRSRTAKSNTIEAAIEPPGERESSETPEETLARVYDELNTALADELLERIKKAPPAFFEQVVVDLMLAMGYGGSREDAGKVLGRSGDGGVDGVINEDRLGLDVIYLQAKRWENAVRRPEVNAFVGSLVGFHAGKGVMITTSHFTDEAHRYAQQLPQKVILIDGNRLTALMIEHGVGVSAQQTYYVKRVDQDYFELFDSYR